MGGLYRFQSHCVGIDLARVYDRERPGSCRIICFLRGGADRVEVVGRNGAGEPPQAWLVSFFTFALVVGALLAQATRRLSTLSNARRPPDLLPRMALLLLWMLATIVAVPRLAAADAPASATTAVAALEPRAASYLDQLLSEMNARRARAGSPLVAYAGAEANQAVGQYLADLTPVVVSAHACFHGTGNPVSPGWDYVQGSGVQGEARGEELACPDDDGSSTATKIADGWWSSSIHREIIYADVEVTFIACGAYGPRQGGRAYQTVVCVTYKADAR